MSIRNALILAGSFILFSLALTYANKAGYIGDQVSQRAVQVAAGLVVVYFANLAPKTLEPLSRKRSPARVQAVQRFSGWTLVVAGLGYSLAWLVVPIDHARWTSMVILGAGVVVVAARCAWAFTTRECSQPSAEL